jgi:hypothetical protein
MRFLIVPFVALLASPLVAHGEDQIACYDIWTITRTSSRAYRNDYLDVAFEAEATSPSGKRLRVPGYCDGGGKFSARLAFDETGVWSVRTSSVPEDARLSAQSKITVVAATSHGPIRLVETPISRHQAGKHNRPARLGFGHADGTPFFHAGDTCYPLLGLDRETQRLPFFDRRASQGFSHFRFQAMFTDDPRFPELWAWGGTRQSPDYDRFNPAYFERLDQVMLDLRERGLGAEMIVESFYGAGGINRDPKLWTRDREERWLKYLIARYSAFDNLVYWTLANEFEGYPDGAYRLDDPGDIEWALRTAAFIKEADPYRHPVTTHPFMEMAEYLSYFGATPQIDVLMFQEHGSDRSVGKSIPGNGSGEGLEQKVLASRQLGKPVVVGEYGYEWDGKTQKGVNSSSDLVRRHTWRIVMGGGHFSAGFRSTLFNFVDVKFDIENGGRPGAGQIAFLNHFFRNRTQFNQLEPRYDLASAPSLCLKGADEYVVYVPFGREVSIDLTPESGSFMANWLDTRTGAMTPGAPVEAGGRKDLPAPDLECVLHLKRVTTSSAAAGK